MQHDNSEHSMTAGLLRGFIIFPSGGPFLWFIQTSMMNRPQVCQIQLFTSPLSPLFGKQLEDKNVFYFCLYPKNLALSRCSIRVYWTHLCDSGPYSVFHFSSPPRYLLPSKTSSSMDCPSDVSEVEPTPSLASAQHFLSPISHSTSIFLLGKTLEPLHSLQSSLLITAAALRRQFIFSKVMRVNYHPVVSGAFAYGLRVQTAELRTQVINWWKW